MCSHYEATAPRRVAETFGVEPFEQGKLDLYPGYTGPFEDVDPESQEPVEALPGSFGLIPSWSKDKKSLGTPITANRILPVKSRHFALRGERHNTASFRQRPSTSLTGDRVRLLLCG